MLDHFSDDTVIAIDLLRGAVTNKVCAAIAYICHIKESGAYNRRDNCSRHACIILAGIIVDLIIRAFQNQAQTFKRLQVNIFWLVIFI